MNIHHIDPVTHEQFKQVIKAEQWQCCKDVCTYCETVGFPHLFPSGWMHLVDYDTVDCIAARIHERAYQDEHKENLKLLLDRSKE